MGEVTGVTEAKETKKAAGRKRAAPAKAPEKDVEQTWEALSGPKAGVRQLTDGELIELLKKEDVETFNKSRHAGQIDLTRVNLAGKNLKGVNLSNCILTFGNLKGCNLEGADFRDSQMEHVDLEFTRLDGAKFTNAVMNHAKLAHVLNAHNADFQLAKLLRADLSEGNFEQACFNNASLAQATLQRANFNCAELREAEMVLTLLQETRFTKADLYKARLYQSVGQDIDFREANLCGAEACVATWSSTKRKREDGSETGTDLTGAWVADFVNDGFGTQDNLLKGTKCRVPEEGLFPQRPKPEEMRELLDNIPGSDRREYEEALHELHALVGMDNVKEFVHSQVAMMRFMQERRAQGLPKDDLALHMLYLGPPGTGKTTVARIMSKLLHSMGFLKQGHLVETDKEGLCATYLGQTAPKTAEKFDSALGGTLFIDEAYSLAPKQGDQYGEEAVATLLKRIEDHREEVCVIMAGYDDEMDRLMKSNTGFPRRFTVKINFHPYSNPELVEIMKVKLNEKKYEYNSPFLAAASIYLEIQKSKEGKFFGNGGSVRTLIQDTVRNMAERVAGKYDEQGALVRLEPEDLPFKANLEIEPSELHFDQFHWEQKTEKGDVKVLDHKSLPVEGMIPELDAESCQAIEALVRTMEAERMMRMLEQREASGEEEPGASEEVQQAPAQVALA